MNRTDLKFCLHIRQLPEILQAIKTDYLVLEINGETIFKYDNTYFDTPDNQMFICHHNGKSNRFKVRIRNYVESSLNFLEIKLKNNKGRTIKKRVVKQEFIPEFTNTEMSFLEQATPFCSLHLEPKIRSYFNRFTLVDKNFTQRVTIDLSPGFENPQNQITLDNLVIVEIKQDKSSDPAQIIKILQHLKVRKQGFSKYCVGRSLLEDNIKKNNFKPLLLKIKRQYLN
ncbi:MAG TPA: polyphosphate polymerase domain-containing protein [Prolixibacteraceae bacterium]